MKTIAKEAYEALDADLKNLYQEKEGQYHLAAVPRSINSGTLDAKRALEAELEATRKRYEGVDPDAARRAIDAAKQAEIDRALKAGEFEKVLAQQKAERDAEIAKINANHDAKYNALHSSYSVKVRDEAITAAAIAAGVQAEFIDDVQNAGEKAFKVENGLLVPVGHEHKTPEAWLKAKLANKKGWLGESSGGGTPPKGTNPPPKGELHRSKMTPQQKADYQLKHGSKAYLKLPK